MAKVKREVFSSASDALDLVQLLEGQAGSYVVHTKDDHNRLTGLFWATGHQRLLARRYSDVVVQDNTFLTNR